MVWWDSSLSLEVASTHKVLVSAQHEKYYRLLEFNFAPWFKGLKTFSSKRNAFAEVITSNASDINDITIPHNSFT